MAASRGLKKSSKTNGRQEQEDWMVVKKKVWRNVDMRLRSSSKMTKW